MTARHQHKKHLALALGLALGTGISAPAALAGSLSVDASYGANLGGWTIGSGRLAMSFDDNRNYSANITAGVSGIAALVSSRSAVGSAEGRADPYQVVPKSYALTVSGGAVTNAVEMAFSGNSVRSVSATELRFAINNERVPLLPQHKQGVVDPLGGFVIAVPQGRDPLAQSTCNRTVRVFDGRVRYDLKLIYGASTEIKGDGSGYSGPAITCAVNYRPIAGQRILSPEQQKFERSMEFSITYVPLGNTGILLPHRVVIGTPMGLLTVSATHFSVSGAEPYVASADRPTRTARARKAEVKAEAEAVKPAADAQAQ
jgi:hypothetical protein